MELHRDGTESPAAEQPPGKLNKTAFKLFGRRRTGGSTMPSIFGVRNKGEGKSSGSNGAAATTTGMVRSRTHDGLAEVALESGGKDELCSGEQRLPDPATVATTTSSSRADAAGSVAKSHSFLSLLKRNGRCEGGRGEKQHAEPRQKKGLRGLLHSIRWHRRGKGGEESSDSPPDLILPCSLTASLECVQEEEGAAAARKPSPEPSRAPEEEEEEAIETEPTSPVKEPEACQESPSPKGAKEIVGEEDVAQDDQCQLPGPGVQQQREEEEEGKDGPITGCGDIIADQEEEGGSATCGKNAPEASKKAVSRRDPILVTYQGGGEEMASPEGVDDTYLQELWQILPPSEEQAKESEEQASATQVLEASKCAEETDARTPVNQGDLDQTPLQLGDKIEPKTRSKRLQQECIPKCEEGYKDSTVPAPGEEDSTCSIQKESIARDGSSGNAFQVPHADPEESLKGAHPDEETSRLPCSKPVSLLTTTCPLKTAYGFKESKIPISIKHLPVHPQSQGAETSSNSPLATQQQPTKSEVPRTKIPVSKVLMRRVSNRVLTGAALKATVDTAKK